MFAFLLVLVLGSAWLENIALADVSNLELGAEPLLPRHGCSSLAQGGSGLEMAAFPKSSPLGLLGRSSPLGSDGPETRHWAGPRMPASLNRETNILVHGMHGHTLVYIYIYRERYI